MSTTADRFAGFHSPRTVAVSGLATLRPRQMHLNWTVLMMLAVVFTVMMTLWTFQGLDPVIASLMVDLNLASALADSGFAAPHFSN